MKIYNCLNMNLSQELLDELKDILREEFGKELSPKELFDMGNSMVLYFDLLAKINFRNEKEKLDFKMDSR